MAARLLALVAAVAMVAGALAIRNRSDDAGSGGSGRLHLVCASELANVCDALDGKGVDVTVEPAATTADRLKGLKVDSNDIDGWLTSGPWGEMVDAVRPPSAGKLFNAPGGALARSPFVLAVWKNRRAQLACAEPVGAACVGDAVIARGFRVGMPSDDQAEGVLADAALGAAHIKDANFATNDLDGELADWMTSVDTNVDTVTRNPGARSFTELLTFGAAPADGYLSTEADIGPELAHAAKRSQLDLAYLSPVATVDVLFFARTGDRGGRLNGIVHEDRVRELLRDHGWRVSGLDPVDGVADTPQLPADDGLPSAGVLQAIRDVTK
jgi:hypothetical protein